MSDYPRFIPIEQWLKERDFMIALRKEMNNDVVRFSKERMYLDDLRLFDEVEE